MHARAQPRRAWARSYVYYAVIAFGMPSARLRASALSMLLPIAAASRTLVVQMLPRLDVLADDPWWEVSLQLGRLCCALLDADDGETDGAANRDAIRALLGRLLAKRNVAALTSILADAARHVDASLAPHYIRALLSLPAPMRATLLSASGAPLPFPAGDLAPAAAPAASLPTAWSALPLTAALFADLGAAGLTPAHTDVLGALLGSANPSTSERRRWTEVLAQHGPALFAGLADPAVCAAVADMAVPFFYYLQDGALESFGALGSALRTVFADSADPATKTAAHSLLSALHQMPIFAPSVRTPPAAAPQRARCPPARTLARTHARTLPPLASRACARSVQVAALVNGQDAGAKGTWPLNELIALVGQKR